MMSQAALQRPPVEPTAAGGRTKLRTFGYEDVRLTDGPVKRQLEHAIAYYAALDNDRLLKVYRQAAGQPAPGEDLGGWYNPGAFAPGHCFGQIVSALSRFFAITGDPAIRAKVEQLVDGFDRTLAAGGAFYDGHRFRAYVYDKHMQALVDAYRFAGIERAADVLGRATDAALPHLPEKALTRQEQAQRPHKDVSDTWDESYTLAENLFIAFETFGEPRYLEMARRFLHDEAMFAPLARGEDVLPGLHAYSHMNALSSAARAYVALGSEMHLRAIENAWNLIESHQRYASGGWGPDEAFVEPGRGLLGESLTRTHKHFETPCGSYAHMKLARYLLQITGDGRYGDGLERIIYNGIAAALEMGPEGRTFYYSDYGPQARKTWHPEQWPCCAGTYPLAVADYGISSYLHDEDGVYVNLYVPSAVTWQSPAGERVTITQRTAYPFEPHCRIDVAVPSPQRFSLRLRVPQWMETPLRISINGEPHSCVPSQDRFAEITRTWADGDRIEVHLPLPQRTERVDAQHPDLVALMRGPLMMVAVDAPADAALADLPPESLLPFMLVRDQTYTTYFRHRDGGAD